MSTFNILDLIALLLGIGMLIASFSMDSKSSFESGSFLTEMALMVMGGGLAIAALLAKVVELFFR